MGVPREEIKTPEAEASVTVTALRRGKSGAWSIEFEVDIDARIDDTRTVRVRRTLSVLADQQHGRKATGAA